MVVERDVAHSELHKCASVPTSVLPRTSCPSTMTTMTRVDVPPSGTSSDTRSSSPLSEIEPKPVPLDPMTSKILIISTVTSPLRIPPGGRVQGCGCAR
ncbi:hypothetical protein SCLCIDRAFT_674912 [Scleroderma citrinum Foug A]|uniref:Uncharacterized protein n=1 Tax=Scleroderma citrinum Foug A TaxID=1036808 RepID=A0A0C3E672_9AGAM|nr:hypothetical protein SCLCIDRAFT_674912 [Scleroderma citrinum Foug A]